MTLLSLMYDHADHDCDHSDHRPEDRERNQASSSARAHLRVVYYAHYAPLWQGDDRTSRDRMPRAVDRVAALVDALG